jgi:hypothetical protein
MAVVQITGVQMVVVQMTRVAKWQVYKKCNRGTKTCVRYFETLHMGDSNRIPKRCVT